MKINKTFLINSLYDLLSILVFLFVGLGFYTIANLIIGTVQRNDMGFFSLVFGLFSSFIVSFGLILVSLSFFKSQIYKTDRKSNKDNFSEMLKFHTKWLPLWVLLYVILSFIVDVKYQGYYLIVGFLGYSVLTQSIRSKLSLHINNNMKSILWNNLFKYLLIFITFIILSLVGLGIFSLLNLNLINVIWLAIIYLFTLSWGREFLSMKKSNSIK